MTMMSTTGPNPINTNESPAGARYGERATLLSVLLSIVLVVTAAVTARLGGGGTTVALLWASIVTAALQLIVFAHVRLLRRESDEALERRALAARSEENESALFESRELDMFAAARTQRQFDRYVVPMFAVAMTLVAGWASYRAARAVSAPPTGAMLPAALAVTAAAVSFVVGRYLAALSRDGLLRPLRAAAGGWMLSSLLAAAAAVAMGAAGTATGLPSADRWIAYACAVLFGLLALEGVINLVLEPYRPRTGRADARPLYESRLLDLLAQPAGLIRTAAEALDYQFGFRVSDTWFYRFVARAFVPLVLFQLGTLYLLTCLVYVAPEEVALLERFGRRAPGREVLEAGIHLKWPWPIEAAWRYPAKRVLESSVGMRHDKGEPGMAGAHDYGKPHERPKVILWTEAHGHDARPFIVASREGMTADADAIADGDADRDGVGEVREARFVPVNLLAVHAVLHYRISDVERFAYDFADGADAVRAVASRELSKRLITADLQHLFGKGFGLISAEIRGNIQARCDELGLGVEVLYFAFENCHPPVPVAAEYERVFAAQQQQEAEVFKAEADRARLLPDAEAAAVRTRLEAESRAHETTEIAAASADRYLDRRTAYHAAPEVYRLRSYLSVLRRGLEATRKIVVAARGAEVFILDFQQKIRPDLLDAPVRLGPEGEGS